ncbi:MAG: hypothetical protein AB7O70_07715, partial [Hyphomicrobiales bacterium]
GGFALFSARIDDIASKAAGSLEQLATGLRDALGMCREAAERLEDAKQARRHARRFMALLAETLALGLLVEQAARDSGGRKALVARAYLERHFPAPRAAAFKPESGWIHDAFGQMLAPDIEALETT